MKRCVWTSACAGEQIVPGSHLGNASASGYATARLVVATHETGQWFVTVDLHVDPNEPTRIVVTQS